MRRTERGSELSVAIIGGGFCGAMTAVHLLAAANEARPILIALIDPAESPARGVAYGTPRREHLLNVPAGRMGAFHDDIEGFLRWARQRDAAVTYDDYLPRCDFGEYVAEVFERARPKNSAAIVTHVRSRAIEIERPIGVGGPVVQLASGEQVNCDAVVLASGHAPPATPTFIPPAIRDDPARYIANPWDAAAIESLDRDAPLLIIGTGLTMIDVFLTLEACGHRGPIVALSRHGWLPQRHTVKATRRSTWLDRSKIGTVRDVARQLRHRIDTASERGETFREVVDGLRADTHAIWAGWSVEQRARFLRHSRALWDVHRHRVAPRLAERLDQAMESGRLRTIAGRVTRVTPSERGLHIEARRRGSEVTEKILAATIINCTGPQSDVRRIDDPLVRSLLSSGMINPDAFGLGIDTDEFGIVRDSSGRAQPWLLTLGTLRRATLWESIAVPELRVQAREVAAAILAWRR